MFNFGAPPAQAPAPAPATTSTSTDDDEWAFSSALPDALPTSNDLTVNNTNLKIFLNATRDASVQDQINLSLAFSNNTDQPVSELTFQAAVTKVCFFLLLLELYSFTYISTSFILVHCIILTHYSHITFQVQAPFHAEFLPCQTKTYHTIQLTQPQKNRATHSVSNPKAVEDWTLANRMVLPRKYTCRAWRLETAIR
jgi:hypothetical protein